MAILTNIPKSATGGYFLLYEEDGDYLVHEAPVFKESGESFDTVIQDELESITESRINLVPTNPALKDGPHQVQQYVYHESPELGNKPFVLIPLNQPWPGDSD